MEKDSSGTGMIFILIGSLGFLFLGPFVKDRDVILSFLTIFSSAVLILIGMVINR